MTRVRLKDIGKQFDQVVALSGIDLDIAPGELFFLLGPSGCGKSTLLRLIAGLHAPSNGRIYFDDRDVTTLGTEQRNAVMCFQSYALWPHLTVRQNVQFGLSVRGAPKEVQRDRVDEVLKLVAMEEFSRRKPNALSGGQQQRVALARALAVQPDCLLLDEPLSNLDAKMRLKMRGDIRRICKSAGCTTIYVTHDQKEALSIADRIAVLNEGKLSQVGPPRELYEEPANAFVADFIGSANLIPAQVTRREGATVVLDSAHGELRVHSTLVDLPPRVLISIRPDQLHLGRESVNRLSGRLLESAFLGESSEHVFAARGQRIRIAVMPPNFSPPDTVQVCFQPGDARLLLT